MLPGALLGALGFVNTSGEILSDWWNIAVGTHLSSEQAVAVFESASGGPLLSLWTVTGMFSFVGVLLVLIGLIRGGVVGWWTVLPFVAGLAALFTLPLTMPLLMAAVMAITFAPIALIGQRLIARWRLGSRLS